MTHPTEIAEIKHIQSQLEQALTGLEKHDSTDTSLRQPVHTVYGGAHLFTSGLCQKLGKIALQSLHQYAPSPRHLALALQFEDKNPALWEIIYQRIAKKLNTEPIEDFRIDFEDGYGHRSDEEEDTHAIQAAQIAGSDGKANLLPPFWGIRIKAFHRQGFARSQRTLRLFLNHLLKTTGGDIPRGFVVTLPKVMLAAETQALSQLLSIIESQHQLSRGTIKIEFMVETTQSILNSLGYCPLRSFVAAADGRCVAAHFGSYDYTAGNDIVASSQGMRHPACDFAKQIMKTALAGTGIRLSDGATTLMPVGPHKGTLSPQQLRENEAVVHRAWRESYANIRHSLESGFYQGWDLHPAQLPIRYAAMSLFFLESLETMVPRLKNFLDRAAQASLLGDVFDDAATGQGLLNFFLRGLSCGALTADEVRPTGLNLEELNSRSFFTILEKRKKTLLPKS